MDEEDGDVSDVIRLRGHIGEEEKLAPKLLSADDGSAGDRIGSWKKISYLLRFCLEGLNETNGSDFIRGN